MEMPDSPTQNNHTLEKLRDRTVENLKLHFVVMTAYASILAFTSNTVQSTDIVTLMVSNTYSFFGVLIWALGVFANITTFVRIKPDSIVAEDVFWENKQMGGMINNPHLANQLVSICYALLGFSIFLLGIGVLYGGYQVQFDEQTSNAVIVLITLTMITGLAIILLYAPAIEAVFGGLGLASKGIDNVVKTLFSVDDDEIHEHIDWMTRDHVNVLQEIANSDPPLHIAMISSDLNVEEIEDILDDLEQNEFIYQSEHNGYAYSATYTGKQFSSGVIPILYRIGLKN